MNKEPLSDIKSIDKNLASRLRVVRCARDITESRSAQVLNVSVEDYIKYETADLSLSAAQLCLLAKFFRVPIHVLFLPEDFDISLLEEDIAVSQ